MERFTTAVRQITSTMALLGMCLIVVSLLVTTLALLLVLRKVGMGGAGAIPISDLALCKKILSNSAWPDRVRMSSFAHFSTFGKPFGLIAGCGPEYKKSREITKNLLRRVGLYDFYKIEQQLVNPEVSRLLETLKSELDSNKTGKSNTDDKRSVLWSPHHKFQVHTMRILWQALFGSSPSCKDEPRMRYVLNAMESGIRSFKPSALGSGGSKNSLKKWYDLVVLSWDWWVCSHRLYKVAKEVIEEKRGHKSDLEDGKSLMDSFILESQACTDLKLEDDAFLVIIRDLFLGGGETIGAVMEFAILHIALNPSVQHDLQAELHRTVGRDRLPSYNDKSSMHYTQAVFLEVLRYGSIVSPGPRVAVQSNTINGKCFAQGSTVAIKHYEIHRSKELWEDPGVFRPERFLSDDRSCVENRSKIIPFGYGRRFCVGENLAQVAIFLFLTSLLQKFSFQVPTELPPPSLKTLQGQTRAPVPYVVRMFPRT